MVPIHGGFCLHLHLLERVSRSPFTCIVIVLRFSVLAQRMKFHFTITANTPGIVVGNPIVGHPFAIC